MNKNEPDEDDVAEKSDVQDQEKISNDNENNEESSYQDNSFDKFLTEEESDLIKGDDEKK